MIKVTEAQAANIAKLYKITNASVGNIEVMKSLANDFMPGQGAATCWTCQGSVNNLYRRLLAHFEGGYEVEKPAVDSLTKAQKEVEDYGATKSDGPGDTKANSPKGKKRSNPGAADTDK